MTDNIVVDQDRHATLKVFTKNKYTKKPLCITGASLVYQIKTKKNKWLPALVEKKNVLAGGSSSEIEDYNLASGIYKIHLEPDNVSGIGNYWCETKMTIGGKDSTILKAVFSVVDSVID